MSFPYRVGLRIVTTALFGASLAALYAPELPKTPPTTSLPFQSPPITLQRKYFQVGIASWYGQRFHRKTTASGERFNQWNMTAAHRSLPFGTWVRVMNLLSGRSVRVRITDRGPFVTDRIIDLSKGAASKLRMQGLSLVSVQALTYPDQFCIEYLPCQ